MQLTPELEKRIVAQIRAGSYPHVAAEAAGVPRSLFSAWLKKGQEQERGRYRQFTIRVREAKGQARAFAEIEVRQKDVKSWLQYGPGKETAGAPGWGPARTAKPASSRGHKRNEREFFAWLAQAVDALMPFPEARAVLLQLIDARAKS